MFQHLPHVLHRTKVSALRWPGEYTQSLPSDEVLDYPARVLGVVVLLQDERTTMSASGPRNEAIFENVPRHHSSHVILNLHDSALRGCFVKDYPRRPDGLDNLLSINFSVHETRN